uniref:Nucleocapsid protein n=1 Tax=Dipteran orthomyxo-related virus OKIAV195 TaxID=2746275 RepID=A0A7D7FMC7_9ORTO|nr:nucleocapsid protein [Dipteran orthomyxo-related virus OKIAV195]
MESRTTMMSEEETAGTKRRLVDPDGNEIPDPKRMRATPDGDTKIRALMLILHWHEAFLRFFRGIARHDIDEIADLTSFCWTIHTKFRQDSNMVGSMVTRITDSHEFVHHEEKVTWGGIKNDFKLIAGLYGFDYGTSEASKSRTGTLGAILSLLVCFRPRCNEVRTGTNKIVLRKTANTVDDIPIEQFGLGPRHSVLMNGCTLNPTLQSSMKQSLGPMTIAINLAMQQDRTYQRAWKQAFITTFKLIPGVNEIANIIAGSKRQNDAIMNMLGDIALWGITRSSNKATFPVSFLLTVAERNERYAYFFSQNRLPNTPITIDMLPDSIKTMDFSGAGAYRLWDDASKSSYTIRKGKGMTVKTAKELVFHATWGTQKEDLGLLEWMTGHEFQTRREMGDQFQGRGSSGSSALFQLIKFRRVSKLANASQTDFITGGKGQISRAPTFSGKCSQRVDLEGELFKTLMETREEVTGVIHERGKIIARLAKVKETIANRIRREGQVVYGTTNYYIFQSDIEGYGPLEVENPTLTGRYFYGQDD